MKVRYWLPALSITFGLASGSFAQALLTLELSYSNPGARSLGFGGAFAAVADDATAAYANPAGLVQLTRPEVSIEGRAWSYSTPYVLGGRASGVPTGLGIDTTSDLRWNESAFDSTGLSFLSYVHPWKRWSFAVYRHQLARFASSYGTDGLFAEGSNYLDTDRWLDRPGSTDLNIVSWGFATARRITDSLSLGLSVTYIQVDLDLETTAYLPDDDTLEGFFSANSYLPERVARRTWTQAHDSTLGVSAGLLWRATESWSFAGFVRSDPAVSAVWIGEPGPAEAPPGIPIQWRFTGEWGFPAVIGLGGAYSSPGGHLTVSFEWDRVFSGSLFEGDPDEAIPDADELHLGGEYAFLGSRPLLAVRAGVWLDPDHRVRATVDDDLFQALLPPGEDELHFTVGLGAAFDRFQIDFGADVSEIRDTLSLSAIYSF